MLTPYLATKPENLNANSEVIDETLLGLVVEIQKIVSMKIDKETNQPMSIEEILLCVVWPWQPGTPALTFFKPEELCFVELYDLNASDYDDEDEDDVNNDLNEDSVLHLD